MMPKNRSARVREVKRPTHKQRSKALTIVGLSALAVAALGLAGYAMVSARGGDDAPRDVTPPPTALGPEETQEPTSSAEQPEEADETPIEETAAAPAAAAPQRALSAGTTAGHLLRSTNGACGTPGTLEVSFDDGASWEPSVLSDFPDASFLQIDAGDESVARIVLRDSDCTTQVARSFVGGTDWQLDTDPEGVWYLESVGDVTVQTPAGASALPCPAVGLSAADSRGIVLCSDATVSTSGDSGATWSEPVAVPNAAAVGVTESEFVIASVNEPECAGARTRLLTEAGLGSPGACVQSSVGLGGDQVGVAGGTDSLYLWAGDVFARSADRGQSWG